MFTVESAGSTDRGRVRASNEDALWCDDRTRLYLVADGMGGYRGGAKASGLVVETIRACMCELAPLERPEELDSFDATLSLPANRLLQSICRANGAVHQLSGAVEDYRGMGSTVSAVHLTDEGLVVANVGDSPIWLVRGQEIETLSVSHTVRIEPAARTLGGEGGNGFKHVLTRAVGVKPAVRVDISELQCFEEDIIVVASDGLSNKVSPEEIARVVRQAPPKVACGLLIALANERGGEDNITTVVARVKAARRAGCRSFMQWIRDKLRL